MMKKRPFVVGVGLTKFSKPKARKWDYPDIGEEAGRNALEDAGIDYKMVDAVVVSHVYGESTSGQKAVYSLGLTGIPIFNTNNNCSSASAALMLARLLVQSGQYSCVMALGFEKMNGGLETKWEDRVHPMQGHTDRMTQLGVPTEPLPRMNAFTSDVMKMYAYAARDHMKQYGTTQQQMAKIAYKNHFHSQYNPNSAQQKVLPMSAILSREVCHPVTLAMCALTGDGGAAAIVCSEQFSQNHNLQHQRVEILAQSMCTDLPSSFNSDLLDVGGASMARQASADCLRDCGLDIKDIDVIQLHDCFACNEMFLYEALGLCEKGKGGSLIDDAQWVNNRNGGTLCRLGGKWFVNTDGGLQSKGHPIGASGLAQCAEIVYQLRGTAGKRQVDHARYGLQHNFGIGGAAVVTIYGKEHSSKL